MPAEVITYSCDACGDCADACPIGGIEVNEHARVDRDSCTECKLCVEICSNDSIEMI